MDEQTMTRRHVLEAMSLAPIALASANATAATPQSKSEASSEAGPTLAIVSRHLQWTDYQHGIEIAKEAGFSGIAWTVRPGAHIEPENVERELPRYVEATRAAGMSVPMIITAIREANAPFANQILSTMQSLGIQRYRAPGARYDYSKELAPQFSALTAEMKKLVNLNARYGTRALFHTHSSAGSVGGSGWDAWLTVKDLDPRYIGINFDIGHVTAKGGFGWNDCVRAAHTHIGALSVKDCHWVKRSNPEPGKWPWFHEFVVPGTGMVNFPDFFTYFKSIGFTGPIETYFEYMAPIPGTSSTMNMLGTDYKKWKLEVPEDYFLSLLKRDVQFYRGQLKTAGFASS